MMSDIFSKGRARIRGKQFLENDKIYLLFLEFNKLESIAFSVHIIYEFQVYCG
jgi:hypothetical protein